MSLPYDQINSITERKLIPKMVDNIFDSGPILKKAKESFYTSVDGGTTIDQPLNYAQATSAGAYAGADTLDTTDNAVFTAATYAWKQYYANLTISGLDEMKNNGVAARLNFVKEKTKVAEKTLKDLISDGIYSAGSAAKELVGLRAIVDAGSTVGGISQTSFTWWAATEDTTTTTMSLAALQALYVELCIDSDKPDFATTTRTLFSSYWNLLQPQQRFQDSKTANAGFANLLFNGCPVMVDSKCPASHWFFLNSNYLHLWYHPERNFKFDGFIKRDNQDAKTAKIFWMGAIGSSNNRMHGKFDAMTS